jgi:hypothetical protein
MALQEVHSPMNIYEHLSGARWCFKNEEAAAKNRGLCHLEFASSWLDSPGAGAVAFFAKVIKQ